MKLDELMNAARTDSPTPPRGRFRSAGLAVGLGILAGAVLVAGLSPVTSSAVVGVKTAAAAWRSLPATPPNPPLPGRTNIVTQAGTQVAQAFAINRIPIPQEAQATVLRQAAMAVEDSRFYQHSGVDVRGLLRAGLSTSQGTGVQGGSTISQQYIKNLRITQAVIDGGGKPEPEALAEASGRSLSRKLIEIRMALATEASQSKEQILTGYLNIAYFGQGAFGAEAAAQRYFSKSAATLTLPQAALLAGLLQSPSKFDPLTSPDAALARRSQVLNRMRDVGVISAADAAAADMSPIDLKPALPIQGCVTAQARWGFVCDSALRELADADWLGPQAKSALATGGLRVTLTIDPKTQAGATTSAAQVIPRKHRVANSMVMVTPGTGAVIAVATNRRFGRGAGATEIPLATRSSFSPGSTFKVFTLVAALEAGLALSTVLPAGSLYTSDVFDNPPGGYRNAEGLGGSNVTIPEATERSINTAFVQLEEKVGVAPIADVARRLGITSIPVPGKRGAPGKREGTFTLGARDVSVMDMAGAYAAIAAHGRWCKPHLVAAVSLPDGRTITNPAPTQCSQQISEPVADTISSVLQGVIERGTGRNAALPGGRPAAGKTGTSENNGAAWFAGFTPQAAAAVWVGDPASPRNTLHGVLGYSTVFGGTLPADLWRSSMLSYLKDKPKLSLASVDPDYLLTLGAPNPRGVVVPNVVGLRQQGAIDRLTAAGLRVSAVSTSASAWIPRGSVVSHKPAAGAPASIGDQVVISVS